VTSSTRVLAWSQLGDELLARRAAAGNDAAFTALYERYHGPLLGYCRSILLDAEDADDAAQSALENALRALPTRDSSRPLRPWLYRIAHNEAVTILRRRHSHDVLGPDTEPSVSGPELHAEQRGRLEQLVEDLRSLPERQRGALVMRELNGLSYEEIAGALGLTESNARRAVFDARSALLAVRGGHDADCVAIRRTLSDGDSRSVRARSIRAHLRSCDQCRSFQMGIRARRVELPALAPWLGGAAAASVLGLGSGATGGGGALLAAGSGIGWSALPTAIKSVAVAAVVATTGTAATIQIEQATRPDRPAARSQAAATTPAAAAENQRTRLAAAAAAQTSARGFARERKRVSARRARSRVALVRQHSSSSLSAPRSVSVASTTPRPPRGLTPAPPASRSPSAGRPPAASRPVLSAAQRLEQIQAQIQAAIANARSAAYASTAVPSDPSLATVTAPAQQLLGTVNTLLDQLLRP